MSGERPQDSSGGEQNSAQPQISQAELNRIVLVYLNKKGYHRTESMLRLESSNSPTPIVPVPSPASTPMAPPYEISPPALPPNASAREREMRDRSVALERQVAELREKQQRLEYELSLTKDADARVLKENEIRSLADSHLAKHRHHDPNVYIAAYAMLRNWVDTSLELYRPELSRLLYPIFVHCFLELVAKLFTTHAKDFFNRFHHDHLTLHALEISKLQAVSLPLHLQENAIASAYRAHRYKISVSKTTIFLLLYFLQEHEAVGGSIFILIINQYLAPVISSAKPGHNDPYLVPEQGILQLPHGESDLAKFNDQAVKLGPLPLDPLSHAEIEAELKVKDQQTPLVNGKSLVQEFTEIHKPNQDSPARELLPLPPMDASDIKRHILDVQDARAQIKLGTGLKPCAPLVCMYTFHHTYNEMLSLDFSHDSNVAAAGFHDSYVKLWSLDGKPLKLILKRDPHSSENSRKLIGHLGPVYGVSFAPNNRFLVSALEDKTARLWLLDTYSALVLYKGHNLPLWDVKFSPLGHYFATASHDQTARLWATDHIYPLRIFAGHISDVDCVDFHPNSNYCFTGSSDKTCRMWDVQTGNCVRVFMGHTGAVNCMAVSPDGRWLASAGEDSVVNIWDCGTGRKLKSMRGHGRLLIYSLAFSRDGAVVLSGGADNSVRVWDAKLLTSDSVPQLDPEPFAERGTDLASGLGLGPATSPASGPGGTTATSNGRATATRQSVLRAKSAENQPRGSDILATSDHMTAYFTKRTPVYRVHFTRRNLCLAGGAFMG